METGIVTFAQYSHKLLLNWLPSSANKNSFLEIGSILMLCYSIFSLVCYVIASVCLKAHRPWPITSHQILLTTAAKENWKSISCIA